MSDRSPLFSLLSFTPRVGACVIATILALGLVVAGCDTRFEDVNTNPNEPEQVTPDLLLPNVIRSSVNTSVNTAHTTGNLVMQHVSKVSFATEIDRYDWSGVGYWEEFYDDLRNVQDMIRIAREQDNPNYEGVGLVLKSWIFSMLTNAYGDIPYSEALSVQDGTDTPAYDSQEEVYRGLLSDLEQANSLIDPGSGASIQGDILYQGDLLKWKKLANSLRLRLLMRLSEKKDDIDMDVEGTFETIVNNPSQYPVFEANEDNAALEYLGSRTNQWPRNTSRVGTFRTYRMSKTLTDTLKTFGDPRLSVFADTTVASNAGNCENLETYVGVPNGLTDDASNEYNGGRDCQSSLNTTRYFEEPNAAKGLVMTYAEVLFLKAEAAQRGWISGDVQTYYEDGITASMNQYGQEVPSGYLSQPGVQFDANEAEKLIGTQKWIALFYTGMEGWFNWRRTGYPDLEPSEENVNQDQIPVRFRYPESEQALNNDNYQEAVERQGPNNINTEMWLLE
jgi:hypothetical protein